MAGCKILLSIASEFDIDIKSALNELDMRE